MRPPPPFTSILPSTWRAAGRRSAQQTIREYSPFISRGAAATLKLRSISKVVGRSRAGQRAPPFWLIRKATSQLTALISTADDVVVLSGVVAAVDVAAAATPSRGADNEDEEEL